MFTVTEQFFWKEPESVYVYIQSKQRYLKEACLLFGCKKITDNETIERRIGMKKIISVFILVVTLACFSVVAVCAAGVEKPVIETEMPDCYMEIGGGSIVLYANATVPDGGTLRYQWYVADTENMAMLRAVFGAEGDSYQVPEEIGVKWYCYAAWNVSGGAESEPVYSRLIRVEYYESATVHTHSFSEWMVITKPTCTEAGIKVRECDCGVTERAEVPAAGHNWDAGKITKKPTAQADGEKVYTCLNCNATRTETVKYSPEFQESTTAHTHNFGEWEVITEPTCTEIGIKVRECDCGVFERIKIPAIGHNWDAGKITKKATAQSDGEKVYTCLNCKAIKVKTVKFSGITEDSDTTNNTAELDNNSESTIEPTNIGSYVKTQFPWWIIAVIAVPVIVCIVVVVILIVIKKQKKVK